MTTPAPGPDAPRTTHLGVPTMAMLVVGSMVGAGVFSLPRQFAESTGAAGALVAWGVAGAGTLMLALVFQTLALRRPDLDAGVYAYAQAGFGEYLGFFSAFGYWASACVGNVTYWVLITSTLGAVVPALGSGDTLLAVAVGSAGLWVFFLLVRRGTREATAVNRVVTVAKLVPIVVFVVLAVVAFNPAVLADNWGGSPGSGTLLDQVRGTMLATALELTGALVLIPYLLAAAYGVRLLRRDRGSRGALVVAAAATLYTAWLLFAAGVDHLLVVFVVYAPASVLFVLTRREQGRRWFSARERVVLAVSLLGAVAGLVALLTGTIQL